MSASRPVHGRLVGLIAATATAMAALAVSAASGSAQQQPKPAMRSDTTGVQAADTTATGPGEPASSGSLDYRREIFRFPTGFRNPFEPVQAGEELGPRFEDLELTGVIYNQRLGSVAVLLDRTTGKRYRVHEGERVGQARVQQIRPGQVSFQVSGFGQSRTEVLRVKKQDKETSG